MSTNLLAYPEPGTAQLHIVKYLFCIYSMNHANCHRHLLSVSSLTCWMTIFKNDKFQRLKFQRMKFQRMKFQSMKFQRMKFQILNCCSICSVKNGQSQIGSRKGNTESRIIFRKPGETEITIYMFCFNVLSRNIYSIYCTILPHQLYIAFGPVAKLCETDWFLIIFRFHLSKKWYNVFS